MKKRPIFTVLKSGLMTTIQDHGRWGFQQYGIVVSGAMDPFSYQIANLLVGNNRNDSCLEITMLGPVLKAMDNLLIAITGANLMPKINGKKVEMWRSLRVQKDDILTFEGLENGMRSYLSIDGGIDSPIIIGSKSTYVAGGLGNALQKEDVIYGGTTQQQSLFNRSLNPKHIPKYEKNICCRIILGPHEHLFTDEGITTFLKSTYTLSNKLDRMGYRLEGPKIQHVNTADIISEPVPFGGIQVPNNGQPIILMADHQTTGGYSMIATIISVDIPKLAQAQPGTKIRFKEIDIFKAQKLYRKMEGFFKGIYETNR
ncbi:biotin-dependent carboxyltransferase family protein [Bacillus sp. Marseille-P3661]|uniref:5-oxoprolinase subunit C family protein n=1 Tax=Bacillus sp. Marseille-P3661 TaxID=1936234 RepID=UPI000C859E62|nr:biotin-dependent carboxyltransferase family protein [Bacillus sp. Marseille-P3661]